MKLKTLGSLGQVSALGLGLMGMSDMYGHADHDESIATIHAALDVGVTVLDTGDFYGMGRNEMLVQEALSTRSRKDVNISLKFGSQRDPDGTFVGIDGRPSSVKNGLAYSLVRLGTDYVDVYRLARLDPQVPVEDTVGAISDMVDAGYVRHIGLSEIDADTLRRAHAVHPINDLQIEYSLIARDVEGELLDTCRELGVGITAYGVLSRGLISGHWAADRSNSDDGRAQRPRFQGENLQHNLELVERLREVAESIGASVAQVAIAWVAAQGDDIVPVVGARTRQRLTETLGAAELSLSAEQIASIEAAVPKGAAAGNRYDAAQSAMLGSQHQP